MARVAKRAAAPSFTETKKSVDKLVAIADRFSQWRPAAAALVPVRGVRTRFVGIDSVTKIGAWPLDRVATIHGPSNEGKTALVLGLIASVLDAGGWGGLVDAEQTTPLPWIRMLMREHVDNPRFLAQRPDNYEHTVDGVRQFCNVFREAKERGEIPPDTPALIAIDSMRKLVPKKLMDELLKSIDKKSDDDGEKKRGRWGKKPSGIDGLGGRSAQIKAALNALWLDELVPLAAKSGVAIVLIARELGGDEDDPFKKDVRVGGGGALIFDASLVCRVSRAVALYKEIDGDNVLIGEKHTVEIRKTKIGTKDKLWPRTFFHTSTGALPGIPAGFDPARDAVELGIQMGVISSGSWCRWGELNLGQGKDAAAVKLTANPIMLGELMKQLRSQFVLEGEELVPAPAASVEQPKKIAKRRSKG